MQVLTISEAREEVLNDLQKYIVPRGIYDIDKAIQMYMNGEDAGELVQQALNTITRYAGKLE